MEIEIESDVMRLEQVIAIYSSGEQNIAVAHGVRGNRASPDGRVIDAKALAEILTAQAVASEAKVEADGFEFQPVFNRMLFQNPIWNVWHSAAQVRQLFVSGKPQMKCYIPPLIWIGHRRNNALFVLAHAGRRVTESTMCYRPNMANVYGNGGVCIGSMNPRSRSPQDWETAFYESNFNAALPSKPYAVTKLKRLGKLSRVLKELRRTSPR